MASILFFIQSNKAPAAIYVRFRDGRLIDAKAKTGFFVNPQDWSVKKGQPINLKDESLKVLNEDLLNLQTRLLNFYNKSGDSTINSTWLKEFLSPTKVLESIPTDLVDYFNYYAKHKHSDVQASTRIKWNVIKHLVERFQRASNTVLKIKNVNADFKLQFERFCKGEKYSQNTIANAIKIIKTICYHARNNGIETHFQLNNIQSKSQKVIKIYLTIEELEQIQKTELLADYLDNARDWLIISCETGQRVSDLLKFTMNQIRHEESVPLIEFTQMKTGKIMAVPLSNVVRSILEKRGGEFPRKISDQKYKTKSKWHVPET
jgi:integrase